MIEIVLCINMDDCTLELNMFILIYSYTLYMHGGVLGSCDKLMFHQFK